MEEEELSRDKFDDEENGETRREREDSLEILG